MPVINDIENLAAKREKLFIELYKKAFPGAARYVSRMGGSFDEAKDVFHDALIVYYQKIVAGSTMPNNDTAYLIGTAKNLWLKRYRENAHHIPLDHAEAVTDDNENSPSFRRLMRFLETAGNKCMELLIGYYYHQQPLTEIVQQFGFSGVRSATVQKYKCLEKVRETIKQKALQYDDFME